MSDENRLFEKFNEALEEERGSPQEDMPQNSPDNEGASPQEKESKPQETEELSEKEKPEGKEETEKIQEEIKEEPQRFPLEITLDTGEKIVINNEEELKTYLLKAKGADQKFREAAELKKQVEAQLLELQEREAKVVEAILKAQEQFSRGADLFSITQELGIKIPFEKLVEAQQDEEARDEIFRTEILPTLRRQLETYREQANKLREELQRYKNQEFIEKVTSIPIFKKLEEVDKVSAHVMLAGIVDALAQYGQKYNWTDEVVLEKTKEYLEKLNDGVMRYIENRIDEVAVSDRAKAKKLLGQIKAKYPDLIKELGDEYVEQYLESLKKQNEEVSPGLAGGGISSEKEMPAPKKAGQYESEEENLIKKLWQFFKD